MTYSLDGDGVFRTADFAVRDGESIHFHGPSRAAGVPAIAGLILYDEVARRRDPPQARVRDPLPGASRSSSSPRRGRTARSPGGIPEGAVLQLDPALDLARFDLLPGERVVARAAQRYGMVIVDYAGGSTLYGEGLWGHADEELEGRPARPQRRPRPHRGRALPRAAPAAGRPPRRREAPRRAAEVRAHHRLEASA